MAQIGKIKRVYDEDVAGRQNKRSRKDLNDEKENDNSASSVDEKINEMVSKNTLTSRPKRGPTRMTNLTSQRSEGVRVEVELNHRGQPIGKGGIQMQSHIGVLVRENVRIIYSTWNHVPQATKELIWESLNFGYNVDRRWKRSCLMSASVKWRQYKTALTKFLMVVRKEGGDLTKVPNGYYIPQDDWNSFVISRLSENFKKNRELQQKRQKKNKYPHRLCRKGYARFEKEYESELCDNDDINRVVIWKKGRCNKKGEFEGEELQETVQKIDDLIEQKKEGKLTFSKINEDLLTRALGSEEHSGRVRGIGGSVTPSAYFGLAKGKGVVDHDVFIAQQKELIETRKKVSDFESRIQKVEALLYSQHSQDNEFEEKPSCSTKSKFDSEAKNEKDSCSTKSRFDCKAKNEKDSCSTKSRFYEEAKHEKGSCSVKPQCLIKEDEVQSGKKLRLEDVDDHDIHFHDKTDVVQGQAVALLVDPNNDIAAYGTIISINGPKNCMYVAIDHAIDENAPLPMRVPGTCENIGDAMGNHVAWPVRLIHMQDEGALTDGLGIHEKLDKNVFGESLDLYVFLDDVTYFCMLEPISAACIVVYIRHLHNKLKEEKMLEYYRFVNPSGVAHVGFQNTSLLEKNLDKRARNLATRLSDVSPNQLVIVPCNVGQHWILTMIDPYNDVVAYMNPLSHRMDDSDWKYVVNSALTLFNREKGRRRKKPGWEIVKAPRQPDDKQCGFYVMRYMREIVSQKITTIDKASLQPLQSKAKFTSEEINEVRNEWAECLLGLCI